jgi:hypothetical protein
MVDPVVQQIVEKLYGDSEPHPIITHTERYSDTINLIHMSDESVLFGCTWPKCDYVATEMNSIPRHYRKHSGQAAQRRRAQRRPRTAAVTNEVLEAALALLDMVQDLVDKLDAFDAEFSDMRKQIAEHNIEVENWRQLVEANNDKAQRYDRIKHLLQGVDDDGTAP